MHEYLSQHPFDLYDLSLFHLVADTGSFTQAALQAGLTQSAVTRQIRSMEEQLGVTLFERTTRRVHLTAAGQLLRSRSRQIMEITEAVTRELQQSFHLVPQTLRIGVARSIGLAYLPGYFFAFQRQHPGVQLHVTQQSSNEIIAALEARTLDAGLLCPPRRLPRGLEITHRFADEFTLITPPAFEAPGAAQPLGIRAAKKWLQNQRWLLLEPKGNTGQLLSRWLEKQNWPIEPAMELDSYDTIVNLVSLGLGVSLVPHRVLPLYGKRRAVRRFLLKPTFQRELAVVVRKGLPRAEPLAAFIENVLF